MTALLLSYSLVRPIRNHFPSYPTPHSRLTPSLICQELNLFSRKQIATFLLDLGDWNWEWTSESLQNTFEGKLRDALLTWHLHLSLASSLLKKETDWMEPGSKKEWQDRTMPVHLTFLSVRLSLCTLLLGLIERLSLKYFSRVWASFLLYAMVRPGMPYTLGILPCFVICKPLSHADHLGGTQISSRFVCVPAEHQLFPFPHTSLLNNIHKNRSCEKFRFLYLWPNLSWGSCRREPLHGPHFPNGTADPHLKFESLIEQPRGYWKRIPCVSFQ